MEKVFSGNYDMCILAGSQGHDSDILTNCVGTDGGLNVSFYSNEEVDSLLAQVRVITGVNLPALITALSHHEECAARIAVIAEGAARGGISTSCGKPSAIKDTVNAD